ncbi:MAG: thioesterase [Bacteroidia bacterium]
MPSTAIFSTDFTVRTYEMGANGCLTLPFLAGYMQEAAAHHAAALGASMEQLHAKGVAWVLYRMKTEIFRYPALGENVNIQTWPSGWEKFYFYRDYRASDQSGKLLAQATSTWLMFDMQTRRLSLRPELARDIRPPEGVTHLPRAESKFATEGDFPLEMVFNVRRHDLDINGHATNLRYFQWIADALPEESGKNIGEIDIIFKAEARYEDQLRCQTRPDGESFFLHKIENQEGKLLVQARSGRM